MIDERERQTFIKASNELTTDDLDDRDVIAAQIYAMSVGDISSDHAWADRAVRAFLAATEFVRVRNAVQWAQRGES